MQKNYSLLTERPGKALFFFALPMILGNLLQLTYNAADSAIIGKTLGENSLAAVSAAGPVMTLSILGASGIGIGSAVIISRLYGAGDKAGVRREFATTVLSGPRSPPSFLQQGYCFRSICSHGSVRRRQCAARRSSTCGSSLSASCSISNTTSCPIPCGQSETPGLPCCFWEFPAF